jgi:hypothetical protein
MAWVSKIRHIPVEVWPMAEGKVDCAQCPQYRQCEPRLAALEMLMNQLVEAVQSLERTIRGNGDSDRALNTRVALNTAAIAQARRLAFLALAAVAGGIITVGIAVVMALARFPQAGVPP